jgi:N utilization substance protein B
LGQRRRAREFALQMLFQIDLTGGSPDKVFREFWAGQEADPAAHDFAELLVLGVGDRREELDAMISGAAEHWRIGRMAVVDRNVLRIAAFELLHGPPTPSAVVIDEAIEVAKKFGSEDSGSFINGVLDAIRRDAGKSTKPGEPEA